MRVLRVCLETTTEKKTKASAAGNDCSKFSAKIFENDLFVGGKSVYH